MKKIVLELRGAPGIGKCAAIKTIQHRLSQMGAQKRPLGHVHDAEMLSYKGQNIGIVNTVIPDYVQEKIFEIFNANGADIIICAGRTQGTTRRAVENLRQNHNFIIRCHMRCNNNFISVNNVWNDLLFYLELADDKQQTQYNSII